MKKKLLINSTQLPKGLLGLFFLWPLLAFIYALRNFRKPWSLKIYIAFAAFFGFTLVHSGDTVRVAANLKFFNESGIGLLSVFSSYFAEDTGMLDIVYEIITFTVAQFTSDYRFLFAILAAILAFFITRAVWFLVQRSAYKIKLLEGLILVSFALTVQIWYIAGRWNLAAIVYAYGILRYIYSQNRKFLLLAFLSVFIHWSFIFMAPVIFIYLMAKNRTVLYYTFFLLTFFYSIFSFNAIKTTFEDYAPSSIQQSRGVYFNEGNIEASKAEKERNNWYVWGHIQSMNWYIFVMASYLFFKQMKLMKRNKQLFNLFNFSLLFFGLANAIGSIPHLERFYTVGILFMLATFFVFLNEKGGKVPASLNTFGRFTLIIFIVVRIRIGFDFFSTWTIIGNPFFVYFVENKTALIDLIKALI